MDKKTKILIIDDDFNRIKTIPLVLEHKGYTVDIAKNGFEVLNKINSKSFDIIFVNTKMPLMNCIEAYKKLRKIKPDTMVSMLAVFDVKDLTQDVLLESAYRIIYRPVVIEKRQFLIQESSLLSENEKESPVIVTTTPLFSTKGKLRGVLSVFIDITECKIVEEGLTQVRDSEEIQIKISGNL